MILLGKIKLEEFKKKHADVRPAIDAWILEVEAARWITPQDIKRRYRSADFLSKNKVIFDIKGNKYRLIVLVSYQNGIVKVEWIGTHKAYEKRIFN